MPTVRSDWREKQQSCLACEMLSHSAESLRSCLLDCTAICPPLSCGPLPATLENYIQDNMKKEMVEIQQNAVQNQTAVMIEIGTNLLNQTAEQTRKLTDVEAQVGRDSQTRSSTASCCTATGGRSQSEGIQRCPALHGGRAGLQE
ncbi:hypothetical protein CB1_000350057 [Camelus ferus]|nr:hypothetical protein CB1_000350057 [Camelus ferus]